MSKTINLFIKLCALCALVTCTWLVSRSTASNALKPQNDIQLEKQIRVTTNQLEMGKGVVPLELKCEDAELSRPDKIEKLSCILINHTQRNVTAASVNISILIERDGKDFQDSGYLTFDSVLLSDLSDPHESKLVAPGGEYRIQELPTAYDGVVKGISVGLDYVEFSDKGTLGNKAGSRIIDNTRIGAAKYKDWLVKQYENNGRSVDAIVPLLEKGHTLPEDLDVQDSNQQEGARSYRNYALRAYTTQGAEGLRKHLKQQKHP
jgi:hypothetical protein